MRTLPWGIRPRITPAAAVSPRGIGPCRKIQAHMVTENRLSPVRTHDGGCPRRGRKSPGEPNRMNRHEILWVPHGIPGPFFRRGGGITIFILALTVFCSCAWVAKPGQRHRLQGPVSQEFVGSNPSPRIHPRGSGYLRNLRYIASHRRDTGQGRNLRVSLSFCSAHA
jgi:hypothetical protein